MCNVMCMLCFHPNNRFDNEILVMEMLAQFHNNTIIIVNCKKVLLYKFIEAATRTNAAIVVIVVRSKI